MIDFKDPTGRTSVEHRDGIDWFHAPIPRRLHRCTAWTVGWFNWFSKVERCACGAIRHDGRGHWAERNSRRRGKA